MNKSVTIVIKVNHEKNSIIPPGFSARLFGRLGIRMFNRDSGADESQPDIQMPIVDHTVDPSEDRPGCFPWSPSPMVWHNSEDLAYKRTIDDYISAAINYGGPSDLDPAVRHAATLNYFSTDARLIENNYGCYQGLIDKQSDLSSEMATILDKAKNGYASQNELVSLIKDTPLVSIELAKLTHPFGQRSEHLNRMSGLVQAAIVDNGGTFYDENQEQNVGMKISHHEKHTSHFIVTSKSLVGEVDDVVIVKRCAFMVLAREDLHFDPDVIDRMQQMAAKTGSQKWHERVFGRSGAKEFIESAYAGNETQPDFMLPLSTVYYAYR